MASRFFRPPLTAGNCDCNCPDVLTDCCRMCLPACLLATIEGWGDGYLFAAADETYGVSWSGYIWGGACAPSHPEDFVFLALACDCDQYGCEHLPLDDPRCGWIVRIEDGPWLCADSHGCFGVTYGVGPETVDKLPYGGQISIALPPEDKECCASTCCEEELTDVSELHLTVTTPAGSTTIPLTLLDGAWTGNFAGLELDCEFAAGGYVTQLFGARVRCLAGNIWWLRVDIENCTDDEGMGIELTHWDACQDDFTCRPFEVEFAELAPSAPQAGWRCCADGLTFRLSV